MQHAFFTSGEKSDDSFLNIIMDYIPMTVYRINEEFKSLNQPVHPILVKLYSYQLLRGLAYVHHRGIMHRDVKPLNLLVDPTCHILKICDFGSSKKYKDDENSVTYMTSRYYRAPELMMGNKHYDQKIDIWSAGCVIAELVLGQPLFLGKNHKSQLLEIVKLLGTPNEQEVLAMNPDHKNKRLPKLQGAGLKNLLPDDIEPSLLKLIGQMLEYDPAKRLGLYQAMASPFFDQLRAEDCDLPNGNCIPDLFSFSAQEKRDMGPAM